MKTKLKIGDLVKLNPNKKQVSFDIMNLGFETEYIIMNIRQFFDLCCTVRIDSNRTRNIPLSSVMKVGKKCK